MGALDHQPLIAGLLLSILSSVLVVGVIMVCFVIRRRQSQLPLPQKADQKEDKETLLETGSHLTLKRPTCWLAIKSRNSLAVQTALALHNPKPCSFVEALSRDGEQKLFVSPPVSGWILVMGSALPDPSDDVDICFRFLLDLSRKLGHIQFFNANSMLNQHAWAQVDGGRVIRGYAWAGKTLWNQGEATPSEKELRMKCYAYAEAAEVTPFGQTDPSATNPDKVHLLAARWSVDPDDLDDRLIEQSWGIVGEPSRPF